MITDEKILELIKDGATVEELKKETNFTSFILNGKLQKLKRMGYLISKTSDFNDLYINLQNKLTIEDKVLKFKIQQGCKKFIVISDTHIGSVLENLKALENIYNYALKNNINIILHLGDLIENIYTHEKAVPLQKGIKTTEDNLKYFLKTYPKTDLITTFILYGNHDYHSIITSGFDISTYIDQKKLNFINLGYSKKIISLNNTNIGLYHPFNFNEDRDNKEILTYAQNLNTNLDLVFIGHYHKSNLIINKNMPISVYSSAINSFFSYDNAPTAWEIEINFHSNLEATFINFSPIALEPYPYKITTINHKLKDTNIDKFEKKLALKK